MTFDYKETKSSGALYFDKIESKNDISNASTYTEVDVFFADKAKE